MMGEPLNPVLVLKHRVNFLMVMFFMLGLLLLSCGNNSTGANGDSTGNGNKIGMEPTFGNVVQIFKSNCRSCHIDSRTNGVQLDTYQNVMESEGALYGERVVQAGDAASSALVDKIEPNPRHGDRMPQGGPFLSEDRIQQIKQWINDGAENN
ncbi:MAG: hypothetical protein U5K69_12650 [Balneolaceae bacterium]|nr:hypothetical protein [Balneolaceae bacterium]